MTSCQSIPTALPRYATLTYPRTGVPRGEVRVQRRRVTHETQGCWSCTSEHSTATSAGAAGRGAGKKPAAMLCPSRNSSGGRSMAFVSPALPGPRLQLLPGGRSPASRSEAERQNSSREPKQKKLTYAAETKKKKKSTKIKQRLAQYV